MLDLVHLVQYTYLAHTQLFVPLLDIEGVSGMKHRLNELDLFKINVTYEKPTNWDFFIKSTI